MKTSVEITLKSLSTRPEFSRKIGKLTLFMQG